MMSPRNIGAAERTAACRRRSSCRLPSQSPPPHRQLFAIQIRSSIPLETWTSWSRSVYGLIRRFRRPLRSGRSAPESHRVFARCSHGTGSRVTRPCHDLSRVCHGVDPIVDWNTTAGTHFDASAEPAWSSTGSPIGPHVEDRPVPTASASGGGLRSSVQDAASSASRARYRSTLASLMCSYPRTRSMVEAISVARS